MNATFSDTSTASASWRDQRRAAMPPGRKAPVALGHVRDGLVRQMVLQALLARHAAPTVRLHAMRIHGANEMFLDHAHHTSHALRSRIREMETGSTSHVSTTWESISWMGSFLAWVSFHPDSIVIRPLTVDIRQREIKMPVCRLSHFLVVSMGRCICWIRLFPLCTFAFDHAPLLLGIRNPRGMQRHVYQPDLHITTRFRTAFLTVESEGGYWKRDEDKGCHVHDKHDHDGHYTPGASTEQGIIGNHSGAFLSWAFGDLLEHSRRSDDQPDPGVRMGQTPAGGRTISRRKYTAARSIRSTDSIANRKVPKY